jgi:signal transduction histidine kinase
VRLRTRLALWFIAAIVVTVVMSFAVGAQVWRLMYREYDAAADAHAAVEQLKENGPRGLERWLRQQRRDDGIFRMLLDENNEPITDHDERNGRDGRNGGGPPQPPRLREAIAAAEAGNRIVQLPGGGLLKTAVVLTDDGRKLRWVAVLPPPRGPDVARVNTLLLLAIGTIVVSLAAWLLARRITQPIGALQDASRAIATGRLDVRVPALASERRDEIGALARDFNHMAERLQRLLDAQQQLLRDISHELRSPLARLRIATELARDTHVDAQFDRIENEAGKLEELIAQLLLIARLEHREVPIVRHGVALDELLETICEDARFEAAARNVDVRTEIAADAAVDGQANLLHSAIENVVRNAVRYTAADSAVSVSLRDAGARWRIDVDDHGPGIPPDRLEAVFQPFVRISEARDRASGGYGLGLAIARRVVDASGGTIVAVNRDGGGLRVTIELPKSGTAIGHA